MPGNKIIFALFACLFIGSAQHEIYAFAQDIDESVEVYNEAQDTNPEESSPSAEEAMPQLDAKIVDKLTVEGTEAPKQIPPSAISIDNDGRATLNNRPLVEVEPTNLMPADVTGVFYLVPYKIRRPRWGGTIGVSYSQFHPSGYEPKFIAEGFEVIYPTEELPLLELVISVKRNFVLGSIGAEIAGGMYDNESDSELVESSLALTPVRVGLVYAMDSITFEPYVVPYVAGGAYTIFYKESSSVTSFNGTTQAAPYVIAGLSFQLDWIDKASSRTAYQDYGIESTYIFVEGRKFFASSGAKDPDFETDFHLNGGMKIEF